MTNLNYNAFASYCSDKLTIPTTQYPLYCDLGIIAKKLTKTLSSIITGLTDSDTSSITIQLDRM
jgi:hypothetical protein